MILDVDYFKQINDNYGRKADDKALQLIARVLRQHLRETDFLARYGGEEFVALPPNISIPLSCGHATFQGDEAPDEVFQRVDTALYRSKADSRNRCSSGDPP